MGYGSYSASDWSKLKSSRNLSKDKSVTEVFKNTQCNPKFDPKFIGKRECFDSDDHPNTTPVVVGLDVTGSMGYLAVEIATGALNELIMKLYSTGAVEDPALMCAAYGDFKDASPLQVTQFESDIRIAEQLLELYFENRGSGQVIPTCLWEFLTLHTEIDAVNKRKEKGFVFTIGDSADIRKDYIQETVERVVGDKLPSTVTREDIIKAVKEKFYVFHIIVDGCRLSVPGLEGHIITISQSEINVIPEIIISTIQLQKGIAMDKIIEQWDEINRPTIQKAVGQLNLSDNKQEINL